MPVKMKADVSWVFHTEKVAKYVDGGKKRALENSGRKQKGIMNRLIRRRKTKTSEPGDPPFAHTSSGEFGIKSIVYHFDPVSYTVKVGPIGRGGDSVPEILDKGLYTKMVVKDGKGNRRIKMVKVRRRPIVEPSLAAFLNRYPREFQDVMGKGF